MYTVTLKALRENGACYEGYNRVVRALQGKKFDNEDEIRDSYIHFSHDEPISLKFILDSNGLDDALWALRACEQTPELRRAERLYTVWCARQVQHLMRDPRSVATLDVTERHVNGEATDEELLAAEKAAEAAAWIANDAARAISGDAEAARNAWAAAWAAAGADFRAAKAVWVTDNDKADAWAAGAVVRVTRAAAWAAAGTLAWDAETVVWAAEAPAWATERDLGVTQKQKFIEMFCGE